MNEVSWTVQSIRFYAIVAAMFLAIGIWIGMNIGGGEPPSYEPPVVTTPTTTTRVFDPTFAIVAGAVGAALVILVGGFILMREQTRTGN